VILYAESAAIVFFYVIVCFVCLFVVVLLCFVVLLGFFLFVLIHDSSVYLLFLIHLYYARYVLLSLYMICNVHAKGGV